MSLVLKDTTAGEIAARILHERRNLASTSGLVLTLVVVTESRHFRRVLSAAIEAGREHPSRVLVLVPSRSPATRLDAEIVMEDVPGDVITLKLGGELVDHAESVVLPLLLPDSPVVAWWPNESPVDPGNDAVGALATRRITDAAGAADPLEALRIRALHHSPGDTDLTWTRLTPWRALLAAALDQYHGRIKGGLVSGAADNAPAELMAAWLERNLKVPVERRTTRGPGLTEVRLNSLAGDVVISRSPDSVIADFAIPGQPVRQVALRRRDINQLITEELRRMQPDEVYEQAASGMLDRSSRGLVKTRKHHRTPAEDDAPEATASTPDPASKPDAAPKPRAASKPKAARTEASPETPAPTTQELPQ